MSVECFNDRRDVRNSEDIALVVFIFYPFLLGVLVAVLGSLVFGRLPVISCHLHLHFYTSFSARVTSPFSILEFSPSVRRARPVHQYIKKSRNHSIRWHCIFFPLFLPRGVDPIVSSDGEEFL